MKKYAYLIALVSIALSGCTKNQEKIDDRIIRDYLEENGLEATAHASGIYYNIIDEGDGVRPDLMSTIEVRYKGYTPDGVVFDETAEGESYTAQLFKFIEGWQIAVPMLKDGGKGIFYIPSDLGYEDKEVGSIPPNSVLIFEIELLDSWH